MSRMNSAGAGVDSAAQVANAESAAAEAGADAGAAVVETRITVSNKLGLHARAAAQLVKLAAGFDSSIQLSMVAGESPGGATKTADAKSIMDVMMLAAAQGCELTLTVRGRDAAAAAAAVGGLFAARFGEGE